VWADTWGPLGTVPFRRYSYRCHVPKLTTGSYHARSSCSVWEWCAVLFATGRGTSPLASRCQGIPWRTFDQQMDWPTGGNRISSTFPRPHPNGFLFMGEHQGQGVQPKTTDNWRPESNNCPRMWGNPTCNASCYREFPGAALSEVPCSAGSSIWTFALNAC
jgi:hypothetical protein